MDRTGILKLQILRTLVRLRSGQASPRKHDYAAAQNVNRHKRSSSGRLKPSPFKTLSGAYEAELRAAALSTPLADAFGLFAALSK